MPQKKIYSSLNTFTYECPYCTREFSNFSKCQLTHKIRQHFTSKSCNLSPDQIYMELEKIRNPEQPGKFYLRCPIDRCKFILSSVRQSQFSRNLNKHLNNQYHRGKGDNNRLSQKKLGHYCDTYVQFLTKSPLERGK